MDTDKTYLLCQQFIVFTHYVSQEVGTFFCKSTCTNLEVMLFATKMTKKSKNICNVLFINLFSFLLEQIFLVQRM